MSLLPIHPALVHLPIAFVVLSFFADFIAKVTRRESLRLVGWWSMLAALIGGVVTIAAGYWDINRAALAPETHEFVHLHLKIGWLLAACLIVLTIWRWRIRQQARRVVTAPYLFAAFLVFALTVFQGWYGGEMVYSAGAGVAAAGQGTETSSAGKERLVRVYDRITGSQTAVGAPPRDGAQEHGGGESKTNH